MACGRFYHALYRVINVSMLYRMVTLTLIEGKNG